MNVSHLLVGCAAGALGYAAGKHATASDSESAVDKSADDSSGTHVPTPIAPGAEPWLDELQFEATSPNLPEDWGGVALCKLKAYAPEAGVEVATWEVFRYDDDGVIKLVMRDLRDPLKCFLSTAAIPGALIAFFDAVKSSGIEDRIGIAASSHTHDGFVLMGTEDLSTRPARALLLNVPVGRDEGTVLTWAYVEPLD